jgi:2-amino-4-hydroxy-6-hydroxymethyldihydropteridine diphosphokinase
LPSAAIGLGGNLGDVATTLRSAVRALAALGRVAAVSSLYTSRPWGVTAQPDFLNAAVLLETDLEAPELLRRLQAIERRLGRTPGPRWGPRAIDLDILTYGDLRLDESDLQLPHPRLAERAFVLAPLAELDAAFRPLYDALHARERDSVRLAGPLLPGGETESLMSDDHQPAGTPAPLAARVRALAEAFVQTDLVRLRIEEPNEDAIELRKPAAPPAAIAPADDGSDSPASAPHLDAIKADLVGIVHFSRPAPLEGERLAGDRELAYVEALGIRNPVRSRGAGRIATITVRDGAPVEYGQVLFELDRG